jgi:hypothetical protein
VHKRGEGGSTSSLYVPNCHFFEFLVSHDAEVASFLIDWIPPPVLVSLWCGDWMYKWKVHICNLQRPVFHLLQLSCLKDFWLADAMMPPFSYFIWSRLLILSARWCNSSKHVFTVLFFIIVSCNLAFSPQPCYRNASPVVFLVNFVLSLGTTELTEQIHDPREDGSCCRQ